MDLPAAKSDAARGSDMLWIFILSLGVFLFGLRDGGFISFECRFAVFAREMLERGFSAFPTLYGAPYPDYPATQTALIALSSLLPGRVSVFTAVLPSAVFASLTLVLTYRIGALGSRRWGIYASLLELTTLGFSIPARTPSLDHFLTTCTAFTFYLAASRRPSSAPLRWCLLALGLTAGFAFRGPIGLVVPSAALLAHHAAQRDFRGLAQAGLLSVLLLALCLGLLLLAAWREGGAEFLERVAGAQFLNRIREGSRPFLYYWWSGLGSYALSFPLGALVVALGARRLLRAGAGPETRLERSLAFWSLLVLLGLSLPLAKKARYILPVIPAMSLLGARLFLDTDPARLLLVARRVAEGTLALLPVLGIAATVLLPLLLPRWGLSCPFSPAAMVLFAAQITALVLSFRSGSQNRRPVLLGVAAAAFLTGQVFLLEPVVAEREAARPFVNQAEAIRGETRQLVFYRLGPDAADLKYVSNMERLARPLFLREPAELASFVKPAICITASREEPGLRKEFPGAFRELARGRLGHLDCLAFDLSGAGGGTPATP